MPKYWGKQIFTHGSFPEVGQKQKMKKKKKEKERLNDGNNNGQLRIAGGACKAAWANYVFFKLRKSTNCCTNCIYFTNIV